MPNYLLQLNPWDIECVIEADDLASAKGKYMARYGIRGSDKPEWALAEETNLPVVSKQDLVIEAIRKGVESPAKMTMFELVHALRPKNQKKKETPEETPAEK